MRDALATRDIATVYRLLGAAGMSQRTIAALTSQSQSDIADVLGGRQVMSYDLLDRIATGLGVPRGSMGLAYSPDCAPTQQDEEDESVKRRRFLAHAGHILTGAAVFGDPGEFITGDADTPIPHRIGMTDVTHIEHATERLGSLESRYGGGLVLPMLEAKARWAERLFTACASDEVYVSLQAAVAQLHRKTASAALDVGLRDSARRHLTRGLGLAKAGEHHELLACLLYTAGRAERHHGANDAALQLFQLGYVPALEGKSMLLLALLEINAATSYAKLGVRDAAMRTLSMARDHFYQAEKAAVSAWLTWINEAELLAMEGVTWAALHDEQRAIGALKASLRHRGNDAVVYKSFSLAEVAAAHLRNGDISLGVRLGHTALDLVETLNSTRARDRLAPLHAAATRSGKSAAALTHRLAMIRADVKA
jgi:transcriptional regulator with XRE-family HTH domain